MFYDKQPTYTSSLPTIILALTLIAFFIYQACLQVSDAQKLDVVLAERTKIIQDSPQYSQVLASILKDVQALAASGNKNAGLVIHALKQDGLNFQSSTPKTNTAPAPNNAATDIKANAAAMAADAVTEQPAEAKADKAP